MNSGSFTASKIILVTGAARSGKSEWAEQLADRWTGTVTYIATAQSSAKDLEWQTRIEAHRLRRPLHWKTLEIPFALTEVIATSQPPGCLLIDSLGTWTANLLSQADPNWAVTENNLLNALRESVVDIILVAEETGWGVVPAYESGRCFRDRLGRLIRLIGAIADTTYLITGGHALNLSLLGEKIGNPMASS